MKREEIDVKKGQTLFIPRRVSPVGVLDPPYAYYTTDTNTLPDFLKSPNWRKTQIVTKLNF